MRLAFLGILFVIVGIALLISVPFIVGTIPSRPVDVGGLTCIYVFLIPICFSVGMQPALALVLAVLMLVIFAVFTYIAYRAFRAVARPYEGY